MKTKKHTVHGFIIFIFFLPFIVNACYSPPRSQFIKKEVVVNAPFVVVREAVVRAMAEKNILVKMQETPANATISGNLLVDVEQYADCGRYYGKQFKGYADMNFIIIVQRISKDKSGIQITSTVTMTESDTMLSKGKRLPCISNGRMEEELLEAVMEKMSRSQRS